MMLSLSLFADRRSQRDSIRGISSGCGCTSNSRQLGLPAAPSVRPARQALYERVAGVNVLNRQAGMNPQSLSCWAGARIPPGTNWHLCSRVLFLLGSAPCHHDSEALVNDPMKVKDPGWCGAECFGQPLHVRAEACWRGLSAAPGPLIHNSVIL